MPYSESHDGGLQFFEIQLTLDLCMGRRPGIEKCQAIFAVQCFLTLKPSTYRVMIRYVLSGFELELYSFHEYPYLFWYLYELLYPWLSTCLHRADAYLQEHEQAAEAQRLAGDGDVTSGSMKYDDFVVNNLLQRSVDSK